MNNRVNSQKRLVETSSFHLFVVNVEMAILLYKQGIQELDKAVHLHVDPNGNTSFVSDDRRKAHLNHLDSRTVELHEKMRRNLTMARDRVKFLRMSFLFFCFLSFTPIVPFRLQKNRFERNVHQLAKPMPYRRKLLLLNPYVSLSSSTEEFLTHACSFSHSLSLQPAAVAKPIPRAMSPVTRGAVQPKANAARAASVSDGKETIHHSTHRPFLGSETTDPSSSSGGGGSSR